MGLIIVKKRRPTIKSITELVLKDMNEDMLKIAEEKMRLYTQNGIAKVYEYKDMFLYYEDTIPIGYSGPCILCIEKDNPTEVHLWDDYESIVDEKPVIYKFKE